MRGRVYPSDINFSDLELKLSEICILSWDDPWDRQKEKVLKAAEQTAVKLGFDYYLLHMNGTSIPIGVVCSSKKLFSTFAGPLHEHPPNRYASLNDAHYVLDRVQSKETISIGTMNYYTKKSKK